MLVLAALLLSATAPAEPLTLEAAWERARARSPQLRSAAADVKGAEAEASIAGRWLPDPQLQMSGSTDALTTREGEMDVDAQLQQGVRWPMETWARQSGAASFLNAARHERSRAEVVAWRDLAVAYGSLAAALDELALRRALLEIAALVKTAAGERSAAGQGAPIDASFATIDLAAAANAAFQAEAAAGNARALLCRALVEDTCADVTVVWPTLPVPALAEEQLLAAVDARPDVQAALLRASGAGSLRDAAGWERLPAPTLGLAATKERSELDSAAGDLIDDDTLLGLSVSIPLPLFSLGQGTTLAADAERLRREAERDAVRLRALHETRAALQAWQHSAAARAAWQDAEPRFEESLRWLTDGYVAGAVGLDTLLTGRDRIARARLESIFARRAEVLAAADALLALGHTPNGATP